MSELPRRRITSEPIEDAFYVDVQPYDDSTRMQMPEKTHQQELLDIPIPLSNRIAHLIPYIEPTSELLTASAIAKLIEADAGWVRRIAKVIGIETQDGIVNSTMAEVYPPLTIELLEEEWAWYKSFEELDPFISAHRVADYLGRTHRWVDRRAHELEIYPEYMELDRQRKVWAYPKSLIPKLRHLILLTLPQEDWHSVGELTELTSQSKRTILDYIEKYNIEAEIRRSYRDGRETQHYPPDTVELIMKLSEERPVHAGDWLTVHAMANLLSKDFDWVESRVNARYAELGQIRQDDSSRNAVHYPPGVFDALKKEVEQYSDAGDYLAVTGIASVLGKSYAWVARRIPYTDIEPEMRLDVGKRVTPHYDPIIVKVLSELPANILKTHRPE